MEKNSAQMSSGEKKGKPAAEFRGIGSKISAIVLLSIIFLFSLAVISGKTADKSTSLNNGSTAFAQGTGCTQTTQEWVQHTIKNPPENDVTRNPAFAPNPQTGTVKVQAFWGWSGIVGQTQRNESHNVIFTPPGGSPITVSCRDFGNDAGNEDGVNKKPTGGLDLRDPQLGTPEGSGNLGEWQPCGTVDIPWNTNWTKLDARVVWTGTQTSPADNSAGSHWSKVVVTSCVPPAPSASPTPQTMTTKSAEVYRDSLSTPVPGIVQPGDSIVYTVGVSNTGTTGVVGATISDTIPAGVTAAYWDTTTNGTITAADSTHVVATLNQLSPGQLFTLRLPVIVNPDPGVTTITNTAVVTAQNTNPADPSVRLAVDPPTATCTGIKYYSTSWAPLSKSQIQPGQTVNIACTATVDYGSLDRARFCVLPGANTCPAFSADPSKWAESPLKNASNEFYTTFTFPTGGPTNFAVAAEVHVANGSWY